MCFWDFPPSPEGAKAGPLPSGSTDGKTLPNSRLREIFHASVNLVAVSCECRRTTFSGAAFDLSTPKRGEDGFCALLISSAAPESELTLRTRLCLELRLGLCPKNPLGRCPRPRKGSALDPPGLPRPGLRNSLRVLVYNFVWPRRSAILFPALRCLRRNWVQGHAPARPCSGAAPRSLPPVPVRSR